MRAHTHTQTHRVQRIKRVSFLDIQPLPLRWLQYEYSVTNTEDTKERRDSTDEK